MKGLKKRLFAEQAGICAYCDVPMALHHDGTLPRDLATLDRIVPGSEGGTYAETNVTLCCLNCNRHKRSHTPATLRRMADRIDRLMFERGLAA